MLAGSKSSVNKRLEERNVWQGLRAHMVCWKDSTPGTYRPSGPLLNDGFSAIRVSAGICVRVHRTARALAAPKALLASPHNRQRRLRRPGAQPDPRARAFSTSVSVFTKQGSRFFRNV